MADIQNSGANSSGGSSYMSELIGGGESSPATGSFASTASVEQDAEQTGTVLDGTDEDPAVAEEAAVTDDQQQGEDAYIEKRIQELARSKKVNANDPNVRELLKEIALVEQRKSHADEHIKRLEQQATEEWITDFEKSLGKQQEPEPRREQAAAEQPQQFVPQQGDRFNDIGTRNGWRIPEDAYRDELAAYGDENNPADLRKLHEVRSAQFMRYFDAFAMPAVMQILEQRFGTFEKEKLADIVPVVQQTQQENIANRSRDRARSEIEKVGGETFRELMKPDQEGFIEVDGVRLPNSAFNRIMKEFPEYLDRIDTTASETEQIKQYINVYRFAMKMHARSKQNGLTPQKAKQIMQAGIEQKTRQDTQHRARAAMNAGGSRGPGATSKGGYVNELSAPTGRQSLADLFRR